MDSPRLSTRQARSTSTLDDRVFKFPGSAATLPPNARAADDDAAPLSVLCDLSAYRGLARGIDHHLSRMDENLQRLAGDLDSFRFPTSSDDEPRSAA